MQFSTIFPIHFLISAITLNASPIITEDITHEDTNLHTVYEFPNGTWVENLAVRSNGCILVTHLKNGDLHEINPSNSSARLIHSFSKHTSLSGISEIGPDVFAVAVGDWNLTSDSPTGIHSVWKVDFNNCPSPKISLITSIPDIISPNGMTTLDMKTGTILIGDSTLGQVSLVNTRSGNHSIILQDDTMKPAANQSFQLGLNGIRYSDGYLYYESSTQKLFCRVKIDQSSGKALGPFETITQGLFGDDFTVARDGTAFLAENTLNVLVAIYPNGTNRVVAGNLNSSAIAGATSAAFGRGKLDRNTLYVTTSGAVDAPVNGTFTEGGKLVAIIL